MSERTRLIAAGGKTSLRTISPGKTVRGNCSLQRFAIALIEQTDSEIKALLQILKDEYGIEPAKEEILQQPENAEKARSYKSSAFDREHYKNLKRFMAFEMKRRMSKEAAPIKIQKFKRIK